MIFGGRKVRKLKLIYVPSMSISTMLGVIEIYMIIFLIFLVVMFSLPWIVLLELTRKWKHYFSLWLLITLMALAGDALIYYGIQETNKPRPGKHEISGPTAPVPPFSKMALLLIVISSVPTTIYVFTRGLPNDRHN
jgi:hypothetical protein